MAATTRRRESRCLRRSNKVRPRNGPTSDYTMAPMTRGFTIVELLVVITIIVILLALLMPGMDRAIYQAELAVCAAKLDAVSSGTTLYALNHRRAYPYRPCVVNGRRCEE